MNARKLILRGRAKEKREPADEEGGGAYLRQEDGAMANLSTYMYRICCGPGLLFFKQGINPKSGYDFGRRPGIRSDLKKYPISAQTSILTPRFHANLRNYSV